MLPLDVPLIPDEGYPVFLTRQGDGIGSVHFSVSDPALSDARQRLERRDADTILSALKLVGDMPKYVLMNSRLHAPDKYFDQDSLDATARRLAVLVEEADIRGVIFADAYYLRALSDAYPKLAGKLEAVPSINAMIDSPDKAFAWLDLVDDTAFEAPSRLVLDRALNRNMERLSVTSATLRKRRPELQLLLIANEGCLYQCPFKPAHDAHVALVNEGLCGERTFAMNREFGCVCRMLGEPGTLLASPFVRPEDVERYAPYVDGLKLCGRNRGIDFLERAVTAYLAGTYTGNLLDLMDAMGDLADRVDVPNPLLPEDFFDRVTACDKDCRHCGWCATVAGDIVSRIDPGLPRL